MLSSVSASSAALMKYAQALAIAAPEAAPRDSDAAPRTEQEAARQNAERTPVQSPQQDTLARDARATVDALLDILHSRVLSALTGLGLPDEIAQKAAVSATVQLASALAGESRHAVEIVHALMEQLQSAPAAGNAASPDRLLQLVAKGLTVIVDHRTGDVRVTPPQVGIAPHQATAHPATPHHLLDFTDYSAEKAAPVVQALSSPRRPPPSPPPGRHPRRRPRRARVRRPSSSRPMRSSMRLPPRLPQRLPPCRARRSRGPRPIPHPRMPR